MKSNKLLLVLFYVVSNISAAWENEKICEWCTKKLAEHATPTSSDCLIFSTANTTAGVWGDVCEPS